MNLWGKFLGGTCRVNTVNGINECMIGRIIDGTKLETDRTKTAKFYDSFIGLMDLIMVMHLKKSSPHAVTLCRNIVFRPKIKN